MKALEIIFSVICIGGYRSFYAVAELILPNNIPDAPDIDDELSYSQLIREDWQYEISDMDNELDKFLLSLAILKDSVLFRVDAVTVLLLRIPRYEIVTRMPFVIKHKTTCSKSKFHT